MDFNQFTLKAQKAISNAQNMALIAGHQLIENGHLLNAMLEVDKNVIPHLLKKFSINVGIIKETVSSIVKSYPKVSGGDSQMSRAMQKTPPCKSISHQIYELFTPMPGTGGFR